MQNRSLLYQPKISADGPQLDQLEDERVTILRSSDGMTLSIKDNWRDPAQAEKTLKRLWTGTTVFTEKGHYPQVMIDDYTEEALVPKTLIVPQEPTEEERELHNLTHMPYRAWCPLCVRCKGAGDYHKQYYDKKPVVQVDYSFITQKLSADGDGKGKTLSATVL